MRFITLYSPEQLGYMLSIAFVRGYIAKLTALVNHMRALLQENTG